VYIGLKRFDRALQFLSVAVTVPAECVSAIMLEVQIPPAMRQCRRHASRPSRSPGARRNRYCTEALADASPVPYASVAGVQKVCFGEPAPARVGDEAPLGTHNAVYCSLGGCYGMRSHYLLWVFTPARSHWPLLAVRAQPPEAIAIVICTIPATRQKLQTRECRCLASCDL